MFFKKKKKIKLKFKIKTICVGNIYIGGTGKTSLSIKINKILNKKILNHVLLKKFYKNQIDEQKLLKKMENFFIIKKRIEAIKKAEKENYEVAILMMVFKINQLIMI